MAQAAPSRHQGHHAKPTHRLLPPTSTILKTIKYEAQMGSRMRKLNCSSNTQNEKSLYHQSFIDFRCYLELARFEPRPINNISPASPSIPPEPAIATRHGNGDGVQKFLADLHRRPAAHQFGARPDQTVDTIGRRPRFRGAPAAHLILKLGETVADVVNAVLLIPRRNRFGTKLLATTGRDHPDGNQRINRSDSRFDHFAAEVLFRNDAVSLPTMECTNSAPCPLLGAVAATQIGQYVRMPIGAQAGDDDTSFGAVFGRCAWRIDAYHDPLH